MNNFHYKGAPNNLKSDRSTKLLEQLQIIQRQIEDGNKKLAEKKKLQEQFYEDNNRMNLADQIMNELLNQKPISKNINNNPSNIGNVPIQQPIRYSPPYQQVDFRQQKINFKPQIERSPIKKNQFVNPREVQKLKLQNKNAQQQFPFGGNSRQKDRRIKYENANRISPERQLPNKDNYVAINQKPKQIQKQPQKQANPFLKNQQNLRQKRQQQQKQYRKLLQQQMQQQKRRKQSEKQKYKQQIQQKFNNYTPAIPSVQSPNNQNKPNLNNENAFKKRRDPNAQYNPIEKPISQIRQSDLQYMKLQLQDLKNRFKKGRINHEQYDQQVKKLQNHYKFKIEDIQNQKNKEQIIEEKQQPIRNFAEEKLSYAQPTIKNNSEKLKPSFEQNQRRQLNTSLNRNILNQGYGYPLNTSVPIQSIQRQQILPNYSNFQSPTGPQNNNQADYQMQFMFKLLEQFRNIYKIQTQTMLNEKKVLQDTLTKMIPNVNPIMLTQQLPANQIPQAQKQFFTDVKKIQKFDNFPKNMHGGIQHSTPQSESEISSSSIEKSLSGIVNKIPLTKKQKEEDKGDSNKDLIKFYDRKCKIKKFKGFEYKQADNQSALVIPSVSNFLQTKNSHNQLNQAFERDLRNYKKLQKQRDMQVMAQKIKKSKQSEIKDEQKKQKKNLSTKIQKNASQQLTSFYKAQATKNLNQKIKDVHQPATNPFLKKHISNQSNHSHNQATSKQKQIIKNIQNYNSPVQKHTEILQQEQYQTQPRKVESPLTSSNYLRIPLKSSQQGPNIPSHPPSSSSSSIQVQTYNKQYPSSKIMNIMKANNQILAKYEMTPPQYSQAGSNSLSSIKQIVRADSSKDMSSKQYFSGHQISPVQRRQYQSSLDTVRSQQQSGRFDRKSNRDLLGSQQRSIISNNFRSPTSPYVPVEASPTIQSIEQDKQISVSNNLYQSFQQNNFNMGYSQTVQSLEESQGKLISFQRPPNNSKKAGRSVSRKKQSVVKIGASDSFQKSGLSGIPSEGSKQKSTLGKNYQQQQSLANVQNPKFDSNVYESGYEQSMSIQTKNIKTKQSAVTMNQASMPKNFKQATPKQVQIQPSFSNVSKKQKYDQQQINDPTVPSAVISKPILNISNWKSLDQARKLAKQYKIKAGEEHNRSSVQQKLSQLQSFIHTNKKQQSIISLPQPQPQTQKQNKKQQTTNKKKDNISKLLDDLGEDQEDYQADFDSYKEESQMK